MVDQRLSLAFITKLPPRSLFLTLVGAFSSSDLVEGKCALTYILNLLHGMDV